VNSSINIRVDVNRKTDEKGRTAALAHTPKHVVQQVLWYIVANIVLTKHTRVVVCTFFPQSLSKDSQRNRRLALEKSQASL